ncbi:long-chain fatty acid--CoA ligase [Actinoallomurus spadix]|uniref:Long-chain fatty acid--CoA ligase n=1 Tax=Actinoallomurus spadix TaxID=79912 RepID=A0ABN0WMS4_9ACTN|nr:long-chain fatty acid--CoA ligase [Actinoallomurus spadix]MCO5984642.1 long-chain fatty acid--CoA ligase [Actinoallomurus spadix]
MRNQGIGSWTARRARKTPKRTALVFGDHRLSYAALHDRATRLAHVLRDRGVRPGDRVAYLGPNHPAYLETLFATGVLGAVFVPLNSRLTGPELVYQLRDSGSAVLVHADRDAETLQAVHDGAAPRAALAVGDPVHPADLPYDALIEAASAEPIDEEVGPGDPCLIMYTSGTTGRPKGAVLTHGNITWNSVNVLVDVDLSGDEVMLVSAPLFHTAALNMTCLPTLLKGGTVVLEQAFDPARTLELIARYHVTCLFGVPAMYDRIAADPGFTGADLSSVRSLLCGGAPVPARTIRTYLDRGLAFVQGYGMTEASPGVLLLDRADSLDKAGSAGVPHFFTDVRLVDPLGDDVPPGRRGEVLVQGPNVTAGYWGLPQATAESISDGWFHTGDVAVADEDGYVTIVDRLKDVIISGGENIYPAEVEDALLEHPAVRDCAVIGVPDPHWGEVGRAVVVPEPGAAPAEADLLAHLEGRLARYKIPKSVVFAGSLPRTPSGKLLKPAIRSAHGSTGERDGGR